MTPAIEPIRDGGTTVIKNHSKHSNPPAPERKVQGTRYDDSWIYFSLLQTVSTAFLNGTPMRQCRARLKSASLQDERVYDYGLRVGSRNAPLVFFVPGFGCPHTDRMALYISELLNRRGLHVATLHSPSHPEFLLNSHSHGVAGVPSADGEDLLTGIRAATAQLRAGGLEFGKIQLLGYSMGALNAAFAFRSGRREFERAVLVNPPVDMAHGIGQLDGFLQALELAPTARLRLLLKVILGIVALRNLRMAKDRMIKLFLSNPVWSELELRAMIGHSFSKTVAGGILAASRNGTLPRDHRVRTFTDFCQHATLPHYRRTHSRATPEAKMEDMFASESLMGIAHELARDGRVHLLHNEDDFLLREQDAAWLKARFAANAVIFEKGGHLGNVWRPEFHAALEASLGI